MAVADRAFAPTSLVKQDYIFVVNPKGANGSTGKQWKKLYPTLCAELSKHCNVHEAFTSGPSHASEIARKAVREGAAAVIAVGGDGTLHEVLNGFIEDVDTYQNELSTKTALGLIPLGTGSDFARTFCWKNDPYQAMERIARGERRRIDVGRVTVGENRNQHLFLNVGDVHLSAKAGFYAGKYKWMGNFSYIIGALRAFINHSNCDFDIRINGGEWQHFPQVTSVAVGNAKYFGGGMKITPTANPMSGELEVIILQRFRWYHFLHHLYKLYAGTHTSLTNVTMERVKSVEIRKHGQVDADDEIYVQADGEHLGFLPVTFTVLPQVLDFIC